MSNSLVNAGFVGCSSESVSELSESDDDEEGEEEEELIVVENERFEKKGLVGFSELRVLASGVVRI